MLQWPRSKAQPVMESPCLGNGTRTLSDMKPGTVELGVMLTALLHLAVFTRLRVCSDMRGWPEWGFLRQQKGSGCTAASWTRV